MGFILTGKLVQRSSNPKKENNKPRSNWLKPNGPLPASLRVSQRKRMELMQLQKNESTTASNESILQKQNDKSLSILERFPKEILERIFIYAGKDNNLPLLNKNLNSDLNYNFRHVLKKWGEIGTKIPNLNFLISFLKYNFVYDVIKGIDFDCYRSQLKEMESYVYECNDHELKERYQFFRELLDNSEKSPYAIDLAAFNYKFMHSSIIDLNKENRFYSTVLSKKDIEKENIRLDYSFKKHLKNIEYLVAKDKLANYEFDQTSEESIEHRIFLQNQVKSLEEEHELLAKTSAEYDGDINDHICLPSYFFKNYSKMKSDIVINLLTKENFWIPNGGEVLEQYLENHPKIFLNNYKVFMERAIGNFEVKNLALLFSKVNDRMKDFNIKKWPTKIEGEHGKSHQVEMKRWFSVLKYYINEFYQLPNFSNDSELWKSLKDKSPFLLDFLLQFRDPPGDLMWEHSNNEYND
ncbi:hypothetical protein HYPBUDRAFT_166071 [Hyphopichia burtonii NRRL Y-1933]|uniref:Uncharacterized protein n=1 Tax=Hyphopichia burtonii NRRL Y-1933 TaxID=984485 RepID=A0A1E4RJZ1_9ASCO|nr:hypothetical protein HYPBUDRAFT_166071 [Hyphopichia burtonii NRRL Y-1933]ODV67589.1 hypothetical protein HYPBUDRAFT_166071 [Hyphopichia burtonii NRRL Y-1933]